MTQDNFNPIKKFIDDYICRMIPGTRVGDVEKAQRRFNGKHSDQTYIHKIYLEDQIHYFDVIKSKPFSKEEHNLIRDIIDEGFTKRVFEDPYRDDLSKGIVEVAIAKFIGKKRWNVVKNVLELYDSWSSQTYEGNRISHNIGIHPRGMTELFPSLPDHQDEDYLKILGSGHSTMLTLSAGGSIQRLELLSRHEEAELDKLDAPISLGHIAEWAQASKVAISLTRNGEILLFENSSLVFAKRRGSWRYFPHSLIRKESMQIHEMDISSNIRAAIYRTALDVAFSRGGACIGIIPSNQGIKTCVPGGRLLSNHTQYAGLFDSIIGKKKFHEIARQIRAELCAIDGATIVDLKGNIVCVGAILTNSGNEEGGGGRSAAARRISDFGIGIKVSNDGYIEFFPKGYNETIKADRISTKLG